MNRFVYVTVLVVGCGRIDFDDGVAGDARSGDSAGDAVPPSGLIAWWKLDEGTGTTTVDAVGGLTGAFASGSSGDPSWTTGELGQAVSFTGDGDRINLGTPATLTNLPALTISAWVRPTSIAPSMSQCVLDKGADTVGWVFALDPSIGGDIGFVNLHAANYASRFSTVVLAVGQWTHVAASWDGSSLGAGIRLYVAGVETSYASSSDATGARPDDSATSLGINCINSAGFAGTLDDIKLFDRVLTPAEIAAL